MPRLRTVARAASLGVGCLFGVLASTGWLYLIRAPTSRWPGPMLGDALPLNEQAKTDGVRLIAFVLVWSCCAILLASLARFMRLERLTAALSLTFGVGTALYLVDAFSLYVVRQVSATETLREATYLRPIYLAVALCGAAGAAIGRSRETDRARAPQVLAWLVAAAGLLDVLSAVTPEHLHRLAILTRFAPFAFPRLADALVMAAGIALIVVSRSLAHRSQRAWVLSVGLLETSTILHLIKGLDYEEATAVALLAAWLIARRHEFQVHGDPKATPRAATRVLVWSCVLYAYGAVASLIRGSGAPFSFGFAFSRTGAALARLASATHHSLAAHPHWIPPLFIPLGLFAEATVVGSWLRPWRPHGATEEQRVRARALVRAWGDDSLAAFALRADHTYFFEARGRALIAYRVRRGVALISGDPIGARDALPATVTAFLTFAQRRGWRVAVLGASDEGSAIYAACGLRRMYWGDEAVVEVAEHSLEGRAIRKVRQSMHRLQRAGYRADIRWAHDIPIEGRATLEEVEQVWLQGRARHTSMMQMDKLFQVGDEYAVFAIGRDATGRARGFLHFVIGATGSKTLSLSSMPRAPQVPNGFNEWLVCEAVEWAREQGIARLSLNFAPFGELLSPEVERKRARRLPRNALRAMKRILQLQLDNLLMFNRKFAPHWVPRYVMYERHADLPGIAVAALAAEGFLGRVDA